MDVPADRSAATGPAQVQPAPKGAVRSRPRRRPTGEAPPLPYHLQTRGVGWLVAGTDPYAYKGTVDVMRPHVRPDGRGGCVR